MTVVLRELMSPVELRWFNVYLVPITAHQCMPDTAPANTTAHPSRFHHELVQELRKTKKRERATVLATAAMMIDPTTKVVM
jgi:hypothetical protein